MNSENTNELLQENDTEEISMQELEAITGGMLACNRPSVIPCI